MPLTAFIIPASGGETSSEQARKDRVEAIRDCTHGPDEPCEHGRIWHVNRNAENASDRNVGSEDHPFKTINQAAQMALPGDTVLVAEGVYREHVAPRHSGFDRNHMITYKPRPGAEVVIKGSESWNPEWREIEIDESPAPLWQARLDPELFDYDFPIENFNPFHISTRGKGARTAEDYYPKCRPVEKDEPLRETRGLIFVNGRPLREVTSREEWARGADAFMVDADGETITIRLPAGETPYDQSFEVTAREQVFAPLGAGVNFIKVKGFTMKHAANGPNWPQFGMLSATSGRYWIIEDNTIRWAHTVGVNIAPAAWYNIPWRDEHSVNQSSSGSLALPFDMITRGNTISDHGEAGLLAMGSGAIRRILVEDNIFERNNWRPVHSWEEAGLKAHGIRSSLFRGNLFRDNDAFGLWLDVCGGNNRITQNLFIGNLMSGVFIEGIYGVTMVDNNIAAFSRPWTFRNMTKGDGFYSHHASNVIFAHNLAFGNAGYGFRFVLHSRQSIRQFPDNIGHVSNNRVINNISYANGRGAVSLPLVQELCRNNRSQSNLLWGQASRPMFELQRGIIPPTEMVEQIDSFLETSEIPLSQLPDWDLWREGEIGPNVGDMLHTGPLVGMAVWRELAGHGRNSIVGPLRQCTMYYDGTWRLNLNRPDQAKGAGRGEADEVTGATPESYVKLKDVICERVPDVNHDYFGNPRPENEAPTVGPVQDLNLMGQDIGEVVLRLWPNPQAGKHNAADLIINQEPEQVTTDENE